MDLSKHPAQVVIATDRLLLKELNPDLYKALFTCYPDDEIMMHLGLNTLDELNTERSNFEKGLTTFRLSFKKFLIIEKASGKVIGKCGFHTWYLLHSRAEMGYAITDESERQKGLMTEAVKRVIKYGFEEMKLNRIEAFVGKENTPSLRIMKRLGFTEEGLLRSHYFKNNKMEDSVCFSLLREEYNRT